MSTREARRFIADWLPEHGAEAISARATLSVSELTANAVLHTARPFTVSVQQTNGVVRVEVVDSAPHLMPLRVPTKGTASDLTWLSETGRGLQIVSAVANRWGISLAQNVKTVWCEFDGTEPGRPTEPIIEDQRPAPLASGDVLRLRFIGLPVRTAIASGLNVEEAIRDLQSEGANAASDELLYLLDLVDCTASLRLAGRHAALYASSHDRVDFDLEVETTDTEMAATAKLNAALSARSSHAPSEEVRAFRAWLGRETQRQRDGKLPEAYPGTGAS